MGYNTLIRNAYSYTKYGHSRVVDGKITNIIKKRLVSHRGGAVFKKMGHYCRICGRTRANEKFSGKGHKKHICKDCAGKARKYKGKVKLADDDFEYLIPIDFLDENFVPDPYFYEEELFSGQDFLLNEDSEEMEEGIDLNGFDEKYCTESDAPDIPF